MARTVIIPEEIEKERIKKRQIQILMSDEPGNYDNEELKGLLLKYLSEDRTTPRRIREILFPLCIKHATVTREMIKKELMGKREASDEGKAGIILTTISREIGIKKRDYIRQLIRYDRPNPWEKENYRLVDEYKGLVKYALNEVAEQGRKREEP